MHFSILTLCALITGAIAAPAIISNGHVVHERRERLPASWNKEAGVHGDSRIPLRVGLKQNNLDLADEYLMDISHPDSPNYGNHWTAKQIAETFAPSKESISAVTDWLNAHGISGHRVKQSQSLNWIHADVSIAEAEKLLGTRYYQFKHAISGQSHVACEEYSLPKDLQEHVDFITPTVHFDVKIEKSKERRELTDEDIEIVKRQSKVTHDVQPGTGSSIGSPSDKSLPKFGGKVPFGTILDQLSHCDTSIVPNCLRALYQFPPYFPANPKSEWLFFIKTNISNNIRFLWYRRVHTSSLRTK